jgi:transcriptional regulator with XRE-family HTH domain
MGVYRKKLSYHKDMMNDHIDVSKDGYKMNQVVIGKFIANKRRELNLTQEQLGEKLGVSHKSVSKWETGKCMPDYSIIKPLCNAFNISISELLDGEESENGNIRLYDENQMLDLIERVQRLEKLKETFLGLITMAIGIALLGFSGVLTGAHSQNFFSGVLLGVSIGVILVGIFVTIRSVAE